MRSSRLRVFSSPTQRADVAYTQTPVDSIGLNEQEFATLSRVLDVQASLNKDEVDRLSSALPPVAAVQKIAVGIFRECPSLSRIHFHSFSYHLLILKQSSDSAVWNHPEQAVAAGSVVATERACAGKVGNLHGNQLNLNVNSVKTAEGETLEVNPASPGSTVLRFRRENLDFYFAPVLSCVSPKQTVGLGDYISAVALGVHFA